MMQFAVRTRRAALTLATSVAWLVYGAPTARAGNIAYLDIFKNIDFLQTGDGQTLTGNGAFFSADLNSDTVNDYSSVSMTYPGPGSPVNLPEASSPSMDYHVQTTSFASQGDMDAAFPTGTYTFDTDTADTATLRYTGDDYSITQPYLMGTDYSSLQGMDPGDPFSFDFSPFETGSTATSSLIFFTIYDETLGETVYNEGFLPSSTASVTVPGGTLAFGDTFDYEIDFSNRDTGTGSGGALAPLLGFDTRTDGTFTSEEQPATVPEPGTVALGSMLLLVPAALRRRKIVR